MQNRPGPNGGPASRESGRLRGYLSYRLKRRTRCRRSHTSTSRLHQAGAQVCGRRHPRFVQNGPVVRPTVLDRPSGPVLWPAVCGGAPERASQDGCCWSSISLEYRLLFGHEGLICTIKVVRRHANGLGLRFGFNGFIQSHVPFLMQHFLSHPMRKGRARREFASQRHRGGQQFFRRAQTIKEAPFLRFISGDASAGEQQLGGAALSDDPGQHGARSHVATSKPHAREEKRRLASRSAQTQIRRHGKDCSRSRTNAIDGRDDRLRTGTHGFHQIAGHTRESKQSRHIKRSKRADDFMDIPTGAKILAGTGQDHSLDIRRLYHRTKQVAQFGVRIERQRIFAFWPVERDACHAIADVVLKILRFVVGQRTRLKNHAGWVGAVFHRASPVCDRWFALRTMEAVLLMCVFNFHSSLIMDSCSSPVRPPSSSTIHCSWRAAISRKRLSPVRVSFTVKARRSPGHGVRTTSPSRSSWSVIPVTFPPDTINCRESSFIRSPPAVRSSCAIRSKRGNVVLNSRRRRRRIFSSIRTVHERRRSHKRRA